MAQNLREHNARARLDEHEAAVYIGGKKPLSVRTLQKWRSEGRGPRYFKIGSAVRYDVADLDAFVARGERRPKQESGK